MAISLSQLKSALGSGLLASGVLGTVIRQIQAALAAG